MSAIANKTVSPREAAAANDEKRKIIILVGLCVVLVAVLAFELPKVLGGSSSGSSATDVGAPVATTPATSTDATATTAVTAAAVPATGVTPGLPAASSTPKLSRAKIKRLPARDPFVPLVGSTPTGVTAGATPTPTATPTPAPTPAVTPAGPTAAQKAAAARAAAKKAAAKAAAAATPTSAVIWTNGRRQVVAAKETFTIGDATFRLISVGRNSVKVGVALGILAGGKREVTIARGKALTLENTITGVQYTLRFSLPLTAVPPSGNKK
jgi:hypothetical protein